MRSQKVLPFFSMGLRTFFRRDDSIVRSLLRLRGGRAHRIASAGPVTTQREHGPMSGPSAHIVRAPGRPRPALRPLFRSHPYNVPLGKGAGRCHPPGMLTLYGDRLWESPFVCSVWVALQEKGLPFEMKLLDLNKGEQRKPPFVERSIVAKVPTLDHDGFWLSESQALIEYLEERFPAPECPA